MFGDHIARALARERQRDLMPELRELEREREAFGIEDGQANDARSVGLGSESGSRARSHFARAPARRATGGSQTGQQP